jgi:phosphate transport system substrate-binding protein
MKWISEPAVALICALLCVATPCNGQSKGRAANQTSLAIGGAYGFADVVSEIAARFEKLHPNVKVTVRAVGSVNAMQLLEKGELDIALITRNLNPAERERLEAAAIGRDGVAFIVNRSNPVDSLTTDQLKSIFSKRVSNWAQLGGKREAIELFGPTRNSPVEQQISAYLGIDLGSLDFERVESDTTQRVRRVAEHPGGLHFVGLTAATRSVAGGVPIKLIKLDGASPTPRVVRNNNYPLTRPLIMVIRKDRKTTVGEFVSYALSPAAQDLVREAGYITYMD